jgi:lysophospholipase L1-like esterase
VVVQAVLAVNPELCEEPVTNERIAAFNARLRALAERRGARFLDVNPALADARGQLDRRLTLDGVHVTGEGYRRWAEALRPLLVAP